jgi:hypothetical protein
MMPPLSLAAPDVDKLIDVVAVIAAVPGVEIETRALSMRIIEVPPIMLVRSSLLMTAMVLPDMVSTPFVSRRALVGASVNFVFATEKLASPAESEYEVAASTAYVPTFSVF